MARPRLCPQCRTPLQAGACPACLWAPSRAVLEESGIDAAKAEPPPPPPEAPPLPPGARRELLWLSLGLGGPLLAYSTGFYLFVVFVSYAVLLVLAFVLFLLLCGCSGSGTCSPQCGQGSGGGGGSCDCNCGSSSNAPSDPKPVPGLGLPALAAGLGAAAVLRHHWAAWKASLAHHPDTPRYAEDCYRVAGVRLCVGCFTVHPTFAVAFSLLWLLQPPIAWSAAVVGGLALASAQAVSSAGLARRRAAKAAVKAGLGAGLALVAHGTLASPWPPLGQAGFMAGVLALALLSTVPRRLRMARPA